MVKKNKKMIKIRIKTDELEMEFESSKFNTNTMGNEHDITQNIIFLRQCILEMVEKTNEIKKQRQKEI